MLFAVNSRWPLSTSQDTSSRLSQNETNVTTDSENLQRYVFSHRDTADISRGSYDNSTRKVMRSCRELLKVEVEVV